MLTVTADSAHSSESQPAAVVDSPRPVSFDRLVAEHQVRVARLAQRLLGWRDNDVADLVQEVFISAWMNLSGFRGESSVATWLTRLTINECRRHRRRRLTRLSTLTRFLQKRPPPQDHRDADPLATDERLAQVRRAVQRLPAKYREVIVLRYLEESEMDEITQVLGLSTSTVNTRLHRAREMLSGALKAE